MTPPFLRGWSFVYLLQSKRTRWIYVGSTVDLERRIDEHNAGKCPTTKRMIPVELAYFEGYRSLVDARKREAALKKYGSGLSKLKLRISSLAEACAEKGRAG